MLGIEKMGVSAQDHSYSVKRLKYVGLQGPEQNREQNREQ
jgi:hypothetical protein